VKLVFLGPVSDIRTGIRGEIVKWVGRAKDGNPSEPFEATNRSNWGFDHEVTMMRGEK